MLQLLLRISISDDRRRRQRLDREGEVRQIVGVRKDLPGQTDRAIVTAGGSANRIEAREIKEGKPSGGAERAQDLPAGLLRGLLQRTRPQAAVAGAPVGESHGPRAVLLLVERQRQDALIETTSAHQETTTVVDSWARQTAKSRITRSIFTPATTCRATPVSPARQRLHRPFP
jgi:hypothetical protein